MAKKRAQAKGSKTPKGKSGKLVQQEQDASTELKEPYALVLYADGTKGVVEVKSILKKFRVKGSVCKAPNPIDWAVGQPKPTAKETTTDATVIDFGYNIDFLYGLVLRTDGVVDAECCDVELLAKKRLCKASSMQQSQIKEINVRVFDTDFLDEPNLCLQSLEPSDRNDKLPQPVVSDTQPQSKELQTIPDINQKNQESFSAEDIDNTEATPHIFPEVVVINQPDTKKSDTVIRPASDILTIPLSNSLENLDEILSYENSNDGEIVSSQTEKPRQSHDISTDICQDDDDVLGDVVGGIVSEQMSCPAGDPKCPVVTVMKEDNLQFLQKLCTAVEEHKVFTRKEIGQEQRKSKDLESQLECLKNPKGKYSVVNGLPVYLDKVAYLSLPGLSEDPNASSSSSLITSVTASEMVNILVQKLLPQDVQRIITVSNIPPIITMAIQAYINMRLPEHLRWQEKAIKNRIYNVCRLVKRDRNQEAATRAVKVSAGIPIKKRKVADKENKPSTVLVNSISVADFLKQIVGLQNEPNNTK